ncbi:hypothetical protein D3C72_1472240 [compost metagenome]
MLAMRAESTRLIWPAPTPSVMPPPQNTMALDLTNLATRQANIRSSISFGVGWRRVTTRSSDGCTFLASGLCTSRPPPTRLKSYWLMPWPNGISSRRTFCLAANTARAPALNDGAISTSTNCFATACAAASSSSTLKAMMPPKAEVESVLKALSYASSAFAPSATPHGLACLMMTQAAPLAASNDLTHSQAASASAMLLYDSSLPCSCT